MIYVGIDDTDSLESRGTNKLAKSIADQLSTRFACRMIVRHQLLMDDRVPFTSHNGSASLVFEPRQQDSLDEPKLRQLFAELKAAMLADFIPGSDPGLCLTTHVPNEVIEWGRLCQREVVTQMAARELAVRTGVWMEGLGGTHGGVIGALAAIGLTFEANDGRLIRWNDQPDDLSGPTLVSELQARSIEVRHVEPSQSISLSANDGVIVTSGCVDVGKHARPNLRSGRAVMFVVPNQSESAVLAEWVSLRVK